MVPLINYVLILTNYFDKCVSNMHIPKNLYWNRLWHPIPPEIYWWCSCAGRPCFSAACCPRKSILERITLRWINNRRAVREIRTGNLSASLSWWSCVFRKLKHISVVHHRYQSSWDLHWAHLGLKWPRWAPCWPHEPCYQVCQFSSRKHYRLL